MVLSGRIRSFQSVPPFPLGAAWSPLKQIFSYLFCTLSSHRATSASIHVLAVQINIRVSVPSFSESHEKLPVDNEINEMR